VKRKSHKEVINLDIKDRQGPEIGVSRAPDKKLEIKVVQPEQIKKQLDKLHWGMINAKDVAQHDPNLAKIKEAQEETRAQVLGELFGLDAEINEVRTRASDYNPEPLRSKG
jgi:hypothetical protein